MISRNAVLLATNPCSKIYNKVAVRNERMDMKLLKYRRDVKFLVLDLQP